MTDADAADPLLGSLFNNYRIDSLLARGGMGAVYLVRDDMIPTIRKVLKVILPEYANHPDVQARFLREAEAVSMLRHPNIVGIDATGRLPDGRLCMVIPFLEGQPLDAFIAQQGGRLPPHRVLHIIAHIANGLDYAHRHGIVHRDLKPGNVFVEPTADDRYFCKVLDFGIAKQLNARTKRPSPTLSAPMGTPCYMALEQYVHPGDVTPAADVFALGIMTWQMVTNDLPWGMHAPAVLYEKQLHEQPTSPVGSRLSAEWEAILRTALSPDPRVRPQSMRQLVQALASTLPAIEPLFRSGAEILRNVASELTNSAHDDETVRNQSSAARVASSSAHAPVGTGLAQVQTPHSPPTLNVRRGAQPSSSAQVDSAVAVPQPTTLGSSTGAIVPHPRSQRRRRRAALGLAVGSVGVATFALAAMRHGGGARSSIDAGREPIPAPPAALVSPRPANTPPAAPPTLGSDGKAGAFPPSDPAHSRLGGGEIRPRGSEPVAPSSTAPSGATVAPSRPPAQQAMQTTGLPKPGSPTKRPGPKAPTQAPANKQMPAESTKATPGKRHFNPNAIGGEEED